MAMAILCLGRSLRLAYAFIGGAGPDGSVRPVTGVLPMARCLRAACAAWPWRGRTPLRPRSSIRLRSSGMVSMVEPLVTPDRTDDGHAGLDFRPDPPGENRYTEPGRADGYVGVSSFQIIQQILDDHLEQKGFTDMDPTVDQLRRQLVEAHDDNARLRGLLSRALKEAPNGLHLEASNELVVQIEAAAGPPWRVNPGASLPKGAQAQSLAKRMDKLGQVHGRLGDLATRIRTQESAIAELLHLAQTYIDESVPPARSSRSRSAKAAPKRGAVKGGGRRTPRPSTTAGDATSAPPAPAGVTRRAPPRPSTRSRKPTRGRSTS